VPAAAVIPAPIAYTKVVAVKKLVVGFLGVRFGPLRKECVPEWGFHPRSVAYRAFSCRVCDLRHLL
jgi:hypothetical protein